MMVDVWMHGAPSFGTVLACLSLHCTFPFFLCVCVYVLVGMNGLSYVLYKRCPFAADLLFRVVQRVWEDKRVPHSWQMARITLLSKSDKEEDHAKPDMFRPIAVGNTDGKVFFSLVNCRFTEFMLGNKFINTSIQKAFLPKIAGCVEHSTLSFKALTNAKKYHRSIVETDTDVANAYGCLRHNLIQFTLWYYHVPAEMAQLVAHYYDGLVACVKTRDWTTGWIPFCSGVFQGCTLSTILFDATYNLLVEWLKSCDAKGYEFRVEEGEPIVVRETLYADDTKFLTSSRDENQRLLDCMAAFFDWSQCLRAKVKKCLTFGMARVRKGVKCERKFVPMSTADYTPINPMLKIGADDIPFLGEEPFKCLGRLIYVNLKDDKIRAKVHDDLVAMLTKVDALPLSGPQKAWIYNHGVVPRLAWPFIVYEFPKCFVERELMPEVTRCLKAWFGLAACAAPEILFLSPEMKGLGCVSLLSQWESLGVSRSHLLKHSVDERVQELYGYIKGQEMRDRKRESSYPLKRSRQLRERLN